MAHLADSGAESAATAPGQSSHASGVVPIASDVSSSTTDNVTLKAKIAADIRALVENYFSKDNLQRDRYLLNLMGRTQNLPIPIVHIQTFPRMRRFHSIPVIVEALKQSELVKAMEIDSVWHIQRKIPFQPAIQGASKSTKAKNKQVPKQIPCIKTSSKKVTGFEEYYADVPIAPEVFEEELQIYSPENSIATRLETAIQRYSRRRKFRPDHLSIFDSWMHFGGIDTGPKQFTGVDNSMLRDMTAREIAELTAVHFVTEDAVDPSKMVLDFKGVISAWLSCIAPENLDLYDQATLSRCINVPRNFYNYLLHHDAVPEHRDDIIAARAVCNAAKQEIPLIQSAISLLPGPFNSACLQNFGEQFHSRTENTLVEDRHNDEQSSSAMLLLETAARSLGYDGLEKSLVDTASSIAASPIGCEMFLKIVSVNEVATSDDPQLQQLGKLTCRPCHPTVNFASWDLPSSVCGTAQDPAVHSRSKADEERPFTFLVESDLLRRCCRPGMMLQADVFSLMVSSSSSSSSSSATPAAHETTFLHHWHLLGAVKLVLPSYHNVIPNELGLRRKWRQPRQITQQEREQRAAWLAGRGVPAGAEGDAGVEAGTDAPPEAGPGPEAESVPDAATDV